MKKLVFALLLASTAALADDPRQAVSMPPAAVAAVREEMRDFLVAFNEVLTLLAAGQTREAGEIADARLGMGAMGRHRTQPVEARPGQYMPAAMHAFGIEMHKAANEFATVAKAGERDKALMYLPRITANCVGCHAAYRIR